MLSDEEKEKIDYKISQERKEKEDNLLGWIYAFLTVLVGIAIFKSCADLL